MLAPRLKMRLAGGARLNVDGKIIDTNELMVYKGMMISDVPNFAIAFGIHQCFLDAENRPYRELGCKLLHYIDRKGLTVRSGRIADEELELGARGGKI